MRTEEAARRLFREWLATLDAGSQPPAPDELCRDRPELLEPLLSLIENYRLTEAFLAPVEGAVPAEEFSAAVPPASPPPERIGRYRIHRELGRGGMGVVYAAHDEQLGRRVAIKTLEAGAAGEKARKRLRREARAAARIQHPNVCHLYEIAADGDVLFLVMELLEGESLAERLERGPLGISEAVDVALQILSALELLHGRGLIHRDLKPSNIFLTEHGPKILDFGLARSNSAAALAALEDSGSSVTAAGAIAGTPRYMAPEQLKGESLDARTDLFALGAVLFEMLTGTRAFPGETLLEVYHKTLYRPAPALGGSAEAFAVDRVVRRALAKSPDDRYPGAREMASDLEAAARTQGHGETRVRAVTRLIVLPFRVLGADPEIGFLGVGIADAISSALSGLESLTVRSSATAMRYAAGDLDLERIAGEAGVDVVLTGSLLRAGERIRVSTQLVEAPSGTVLWSQTATVTVRDVFELQDRIVERILDSLALSLTTRDHRLTRTDVPASPTAYEFYLRGNDLVLSQGLGSAENLAIARDLYRRSVEEDPRYAPAWVRLARCHWLIAKGGEDPETNAGIAEECMQRALELNPDLPLAHHFSALHEIDQGRARDAMVRLIERARAGVAHADLYGVLVTACRYCGLVSASIAAHERAQQLDPQVLTSVAYTYYMRRELDRALEIARRCFRGVPSIANREAESWLLFELGRPEEAIELTRSLLEERLTDFFRLTLEFNLSYFEGRQRECARLGERCIAEFQDAEGIFYAGRALASIGERDLALSALRKSLDRGFVLVPAFLRPGQLLEHLPPSPELEELLARGEERHLQAVAAFREAGGQSLLDVAPV